MTFTLNQVVPWGRSFDEYVSMFALSKEDLKKQILDCGGGPSSFNGILAKRSGQVVSCDPIYQFSAGEIETRIGETYDQIIAETRKNRHEFVWDHISSVKTLGHIRMKAMNDFLSDYMQGKEGGRYVEASLPNLPFKNNEFQLALCSHFLFLYSEQLSHDFHIQSIKELCRISSEVRIFPLLELGAIKSRHLEAVMSELKHEEFEATIESVPYEFQKGGNQMIRIKAT
ncbi:MAG: SAM-dependent methyltransferase [Thermodesulfobacteriota bacterium]|nr:SAM-dependent methyltransferase [Thermodesulfobacteriota bacterium]